MGQNQPRSATIDGDERGRMTHAYAARETIASLRSLAICLPPAQRLQAVIDAYAALVPVDAWAFSYRRSERVVSELLSGDPFDVPERMRMARMEIASHAVGTPAVITTPISRIEPYKHGLAVHLSDENGGQGALLLLRASQNGEFILQERSLLTRAREDVVRALTAHASFEGELTDLERAKMRNAPSLVLLDEHLAIEYVSRPRRLRRLGRWSFAGARLPSALEAPVREITILWRDPAQRVEDAFMPAPDLIVRVVPIERGTRYAIALVLEPYAHRAPLGEAIRRFRLTNRELEVIALLFSGLSAQQVAQRLAISDTTVNDHVKRLLSKTGSSNRTEMAAKLLGWRGDTELT
jgi:DNA-binding CsgD family transcriptional regulator